MFSPSGPTNISPRNSKILNVDVCFISVLDFGPCQLRSFKFSVRRKGELWKSKVCFIFPALLWKNDVLRGKSALAHAEQLLPQIHQMVLCQNWSWVMNTFTIESEQKEYCPQRMNNFLRNINLKILEKGPCGPKVLARNVSVNLLQKRLKKNVRIMNLKVINYNALLSKVTKKCICQPTWMKPSIKAFISCSFLFQLTVFIFLVTCLQT